MAATSGPAVARDAVAAATDALAAAGCETPRLDAELLVADALAIDRGALVLEPERPLAGPAARLVMERVRRRVAREPVAYILGRRGFRRIELAVDQRVLVPRPETELLVEVALERAPPGGRVHDVGTGSGAVALALADERPDLEVTASDAYAAAATVAAGNARALGLGVAVTVAPGLPPAVAAEARAGWIDLVVANLPYVADSEWSRLEPEITAYEPRAALVAGPDGLDAIRSLLADVPGGTLVALEHAPAQSGAVGALLDGPDTRRDLAGRDRVTVGRVA